jgi:hypothetical protein
MLSEGSLPCKAHTKIQYISNKGAVNELNKNNQKKEKKKKLPYIVNKFNKDNEKRKINNAYSRKALLIN